MLLMPRTATSMRPLDRWAAEGLSWNGFVPARDSMRHPPHPPGRRSLLYSWLSVPRTKTSTFPGERTEALGDPLRAPSSVTFSQALHSPVVPRERVHSLLSAPRTKRVSWSGKGDTSDGSPLAPPGGAPSGSQSVHSAPLKMLRAR